MKDNSNQRIIILEGEITSEKAQDVIQQLLTLQDETSNSDVYMLINSRGGDVTAGFAIYDVMQYVKFDINTICMDITAGMGTILLSSGTKGKRFAFVGSTISPSLNLSVGELGNSDYIYSEKADDLLSIQKKSLNIMKENTGKSMEEIQVVCGIEHFIDEHRSVDFGFIDKVININSFEIKIKRILRKIPTLKFLDFYLNKRLKKRIKEYFLVAN